MKIFKLIRIQTKLFILMAVMIIGLILIGFTGYDNVRKTNEALDRMYTQNMIGIEKLSDLRTQSRANFANILNLIVTKDAAAKQSILDDYNKRLGNMDADMNDFLKLDLNEKDNELYQLIIQDMDTWKGVAAQIIDMISAGNIDEAENMFRSSGNAIFEELQTSVRDLLNSNIEESESIYKENKENAATTIAQLIMIVLATIVICFILAILITVSITGPINKIVKLINKTAELDLTHDDYYESLLTYKGEIGKISWAIRGLRDSLRNISSNILSISENLAANSEELAATTEENTRTINQVVLAVNDIAKGNSIQAENVDKAGETIKSMADSINKVNVTTLEASDIARESVTILEEGQKAFDITIDKIRMNKKVTQDVGEAIQELSVQMDKVGNIVNVINDISKQTNLLSLNASIEAARSGDAGKGFAIVASEIGSLANETASAMKEIALIVQNTLEKNQNTARSNEKARELSIEQENAVGVMKEAFDKIKVSVSEISQRTIRIAEMINYINNSSGQIVDQTSRISAAAQEGAASSEEISASNEEQLASIEMIAAAASVLSEMAMELNTEINKIRI